MPEPWRRRARTGVARASTLGSGQSAVAGTICIGQAVYNSRRLAENIAISTPAVTAWPEGLGPHLGTGVGTVGEAGLMLSHYASVAGAIRLVVGDAWAALHEHAAAHPAGPASPSLRPRDDLLTTGRHHLAGLLHRGPD